MILFVKMPSRTPLLEKWKRNRKNGKDEKNTWNWKKIAKETKGSGKRKESYVKGAKDAVTYELFTQSWIYCHIYASVLTLANLIPVCQWFSFPTKALIRT